MKAGGTKPTGTPVTTATPEEDDLGFRLQAMREELAGDLQIKLEGPVEQQVAQAMRELDVMDSN